MRAVLFDLDGTLVDSHIDFGWMRREMLGGVTTSKVTWRLCSTMSVRLVNHRVLV